VDGEVSYVPTEDQAAQVSRDAFVARLRLGRTWRAAFILCVVLGLFLAFLDWTDGYESLHVAMSFFVGFGLIVGVHVVVWGACFLALPRRARRAFREMRVRRGPYRWVWDADGFEIATPNGGAAYMWDEVLRVVEGRHAFILWFSESAPLFLPLEVLEPGQEQSFGAAMRAGLGGRG
jgi:hypothetical protein